MPLSTLSSSPAARAPIDPTGSRGTAGVEGGGRAVVPLRATERSAANRSPARPLGSARPAEAAATIASAVVPLTLRQPAAPTRRRRLAPCRPAGLHRDRAVPAVGRGLFSEERAGKR